MRIDWPLNTLTTWFVSSFSNTLSHPHPLFQSTNEQAAAEVDPTAAGGAAGAAAPGGKDAKGAAGKDAKGDKKGGKGSAGKGSAGKAGKKGAKKADEPPAESKLSFESVSLCSSSIDHLDLTEVSPEELAKRQLRTKMKEEYLAALSHEGKTPSDHCLLSIFLSLQFVSVNLDCC